MTARELENLQANEHDEQAVLCALLAQDTEAPEVRGA